MIPLNKEAVEKTHINILSSAKYGRPSFEELITRVAMLCDDNPSRKADVLLVQILPDIINYYEEDEPDEADNWRWHWSGVATGKYPLEKLPDHVRDLAKTLYYNG